MLKRIRRLRTLQQIRTEAERLLNAAGISSPPVDLKAIARMLGASIRYEPFEGEISGVLYKDQKNAIIGVSSLHHPNRQRFTLAHEIGHLVLHELDVHVDKGFRMVLRDSKSATATDPLEIEANRFAAELLMPSDMVRGDARRFLRDFEEDSELQALAKRYGVSTQALAFRLSNLRILT
jgi:Zn-dependent peptidase ImmA (M78 family)